MRRYAAPWRTARLLIVGVALTVGAGLPSSGQDALAKNLDADVSRGGEDLPATAGASGAIVVAQGAAVDPAVARLEVRLSELERDLRASTGQVEELRHKVRQLTDRLEKLSSDVDYRLSQTGAAASGSAGAGAGATGAIDEAPAAARQPSAREWTPEPQPAPPPVPRSTAGAGIGEGPTVLGRLPESEVKSATALPPAPEPSATGSARTASVMSTGTPREQYAHGFGLLRTAKYDEAEVAFTEFLRQNPNDPLADNARYWLGESYYARGQYAPAAEAFLDAYQTNKAGPKAPDALLKLGMSLGNLDKIPEACATYNELKTALPDVPVSIQTKAQQERGRLGCK
jgi:tol-pal system protein YbgF